MVASVITVCISAQTRRENDTMFDPFYRKVLSRLVVFKLYRYDNNVRRVVLIGDEAEHLYKGKSYCDMLIKTFISYQQLAKLLHN